MLQKKPSIMKLIYLLLFNSRSTNNTEAIRLMPVHTDYDKMCGSRLEFQIVPKKAGPGKVTIKLVAENVDDGYDSGESIWASFSCNDGIYANYGNEGG